MNKSIGKEYTYSDGVQILPETIQRDDQVFIDHIFSYFNKKNILEIDGREHVFKPVVSATVHVDQLDVFRIKVNVLLKNNRTDWYIPRFEEKSIYSENKIYLVGKDNHILKKIPEWWLYKSREPNSPIIYAPKPEHIGLFARFNKGDQYKLEYIIDLPETTEEQLLFDLFYQEYRIPTYISNKYSELHNNSLLYIMTKSNIVKVKCAKKSKNEFLGYDCEISN